MKKNIFELIGCSFFSSLFYFKLMCFGVKSGFTLKKLKRNHFIYGGVEFRGKPGYLSIGQYLRILGRVSFIYSDDALGSLLISDDVILEGGASLAPRQGRIVIGKECFIGPDVLVQSYSGADIVIGDNTMIAKGAMIFASNHDISCPAKGYGKEIGSSVAIGNNVWIGAGAKILAGVSVGDFTIIAAGSVLTKKAESYSVYAGVPAVKIKEFDAFCSAWVSISD
jgi:acetyltransferase-like isoleucine patch superfamily enzyme